MQINNLEGRDAIEALEIVNYLVKKIWIPKKKKEKKKKISIAGI